MYKEDLKFSLWADFIERDYLDNEFTELVNEGIINGATSNPAIFKNAILNSPAYKEQLSTLTHLTPKEKYEALAIYDITKAADILELLYQSGDDGYVSIEVDPFLCNDAEGTIAEGKRLYKTIKRANVMIKVPATPAGYIAMEELTALGIPVNATLIFKKEQAVACAKAFEAGTKKNGSVVSTVISIFVSRIDRALDDTLTEHGMQRSWSGIYNSADIYNTIESMNVDGCRALFASTGVKDNALPAYYYIDELLAYNSVNTTPVDTIKSFHKYGMKKKALPLDAVLIADYFEKLECIGIDFEELLDQQIADGLVAFENAFKEILDTL